MPLKYWDETFRATVFLYNKLPTSVFHWKTHLEVLFHSSLSYSMLKVFGCACYPNTRPYNGHKLNFRSTQCTFLGYSLNHKGYKCLDKNGKIFISRDVIFYEHSFSFSSSYSSQTSLASQSSNISSISSFSLLLPHFLMVISLINPKHMLKHTLVNKVLLLTMVAICQLLWKRQLNLLLNRF